MQTKDTWQPAIGQQVRAKIDLINDLSDEGMGQQLCAKAGEKLIVRKVGSGYTNCISVSHETVTDSAFCVAVHEIEPICSQQSE